MLWFVGMGISGAESLSAQALGIVSKADIVYLEQFTSPVGGSVLEAIREEVSGATGGGNGEEEKFRHAKRWMVEDGKEILENAERMKVVLLSYGDPYVATTHIELRTRAISRGIETGSVHASSSLTSAIGECGLHFYKIGRIATVMGDMKSLVTPYYVVYRNVVEGNHTVLLLEYNQDRDFFLDPKDALEGLLEAEVGQRRGTITDQTYAIVASRVGFREGWQA